MLVCLHGKSQQPVLSVQRFEYIWQPASEDAAFKRVILASDDTIKQKIEKSFANALQQRWNLNMPENVLSVKPLSFFSLYGAPKFSTKIKDKQQGTWYLFLQIFDEAVFSPNQITDSAVSAILQLRCKLINGTNDSVILDKSLSVKMYRALPPDQVVLAKLCAYPTHFAQAFDSIANWLFQPGGESEKSLWLKPACVFIDTKIPAKPIQQLLFKSDNEHIELLTEPAFTFQTPGTQYKKTDVHRNTGGNIATGAVAIFSGIELNKARVFEYNADFSFEEKDSAYHCTIGYAERETAEREREKIKEPDGSTSYSLNSKSYSLSERLPIPNFLNVITLAADTLATFKMNSITDAKERKNYTRFWNGTDSSTIAMLPAEWNNMREDDNLTITGKIEGNNFSMKTLNEKTVKEFFVNEEPVMMTYGKTYPVKALLFQPLSERQLKVFTILSSLPYGYFNYSAY